MFDPGHEKPFDLSFPPFHRLPLVVRYFQRFPEPGAVSGIKPKTEEQSMKVRHASRLAQMCAGFDSPLQADSPEILLMEYLCSGQADQACALFGESRQFGGLPAVDAPYGRFEGAAEIRRFATGWLERFNASSAGIEPVCQTQSCCRSVTEMNVCFVTDGMIEEVPMFVVGDLRNRGMLDEVRIYCNFTRVPGLTPYRKPIFRSAHLEMGDPSLLTGAFREYYEALHHVPKLDVERIIASMGEGCVFGGYEPVTGDPGEEEEPAPMDRETLTRIYTDMSSHIPRWVGMRYETLTDNGITAVIEWQHIVTDLGVEEAGRVCMSGISAYSRGKDGLLCSIRICDYAGFERTIDWSRTPISKEEAYAINRVHVFPAGVGN